MKKRDYILAGVIGMALAALVTIPEVVCIYAQEPEIPAIDSMRAVTKPATAETVYDKVYPIALDYLYISGRPKLRKLVLAPARMVDGKLEILEEPAEYTRLMNIDVRAERQRSAVFARSIDRFVAVMGMLAKERELSRLINEAQEAIPPQDASTLIAQRSAVRITLKIAE